MHPVKPRLEPTRASLACVRRAFANIEAMAVVKRRELAFRTGKGEKKASGGFDMVPHCHCMSIQRHDDQKETQTIRSSSDTSGIQ